MIRLLVPLAALLIAALAAASVLRRSRSGPTDPVGEPLKRVATRAFVWRSAGLLFGVVVALRLAFAPPSWLGLGLAVIAPAVALSVLCGVLAGELSGYKNRGPARCASLSARSVASYLPPVATRWMAGLTVLLAGLLTATTAAGSADDQGRPGRSLTVLCGGGAGDMYSSSNGPWPGLFYSGPIGGGTLAGLVAAAVVLHRIAHRPRPGAEVEVSDDALRRQSSRMVIAAAGLLVATSLTGAALFAGGAMLNVRCGPTWLPVLGWLTLATAALGFISAATFASVLLVPGRIPVGAPR
ncbi:MAG: hypothetical protein QOJ50_3291 [Cryptosporangiaceae bacterium]|nr:hypothetical protein [Cryptosporangiaceae bacterium]